MSSPTPAIHIENLTYIYDRAEAVRDFNLTVRPGRCYGLFGRNGAGKTTTTFTNPCWSQVQVRA